MTNKLKDKSVHIRQKVDKVRVFFEGSGLTPMQGRAFAYLLLAEPPYKDFYAIQDCLNVSKSAVSAALNYLIDRGLVDYIRFNGDRKRYFRVNHKVWLEDYKNQIRQTGNFRDLLEEVLAERHDSRHLDFNDQLKEMLSFQTHMSKGIEQLIQGWDESKN